MTPPWDRGDVQIFEAPGFWGYVRAVIRGPLVVFVTFGGLGLLLLLRILERPLFGSYRPITPWLTQLVCITDMKLLGIKLTVRGAPMPHNGAIVANHASWLDIFTLNATDRIYFVAKSEVASWFGIGWLARATGTVFVERRRGAAVEQKSVFMDRLERGHRLLFFPEGTSTDGLRVLRFKSTLFEAFFGANKSDDLWIQPVTLNYMAPPKRNQRFYGWWGTTEFAPHLVAMLCAPLGGKAEVVYHAPIKVSSCADRKDLALKTENVVRSGLIER